MANIEANGARGHHKFTLNVSETYVSGGAENYSTVSWSLVLSPIQTSWNWAISGINYSVTVDGTNWSGSIPSYDGYSTVTVASGSKNVTHDSDGGRYIGFDFSINDTVGASYTPGNASANGGMNLTKIQRYFSQTPKLELTSKTETSLSFKWTTSETCNWVRYHLDGSSSWVDVFNGSATTGTFTISNLSAYSNHSVYAECRKQDSMLWSNSNTSTNRTYDYPYCSSSPNFVIGNSVTLSLYNPLSRSVTVKILSSSDTELASGTTSGTSISGFNSSSQAQNMYNSIPNNTSGTYKVKVTYGSVNKTRNNGNTYSVNTTTSAPTFNLFEYADINSTTLALTGNNQTCVIGYSTIKATVSTSNKATANNSATMNKYRLTIGNATPVEENYSDTEAVTMQIANAPSSSYSVSAIDSRGLSKQVTLTGTEIPYTNIVKDVSNSSALRNGGVSEFVTLTLNGSIWYGNFGQVDNAIVSTTYRFKKSSDTTWVPGTTTIVPTLNQDGTFEFEGLIAGNNSDNGFDIDSVYNIEVTVTDKLSSATYTFTLGSGKPHVAYYKDGVSIMGAYDETLGGALQVNGVRRDGVYSYEEQKVGYWVDGKPYYQITILYQGTLNTTGDIPHYIDNVDYVIDYSASYDGYKIPRQHILDSARTSSDLLFKRVTSSDIQYQCASAITTSIDLYITIWYTKTTDTATITSE